MLVRLWEEVQDVPRRMTRHGAPFQRSRFTGNNSKEESVSRVRRRRRRGSQPTPPQDERDRLEPWIQGGLDLPDEVARAREDASAVDARRRAAVQPLIEGHLKTYEMVAAALAEAHQRIAETVEFGLGGDTRWTAVWEMSGRCAALCNCAIAQLRAGFGAEVVPTFRAIHEAGQLLSVLAGPGEWGVLREWLNDGYISAAKARAAEDRINEPVIAELKKLGIDLHGAPEPKDLGKQIYDVLSKPAHNMRLALRESVSIPLHLYSYGPHPDPTLLAVHVEYAGQLLEEITMRVGSALGTRFLGREWYDETIKPLIAALKAIRDEMPVDPPAMNKLRAAIH